MSDPDYKALAIRLAAFCARLHGADPGDVSEYWREQAMRLVREFKDAEYRANHRPITNYEKL